MGTGVLWEAVASGEFRGRRCIVLATQKTDKIVKIKQQRPIESAGNGGERKVTQ